MSDAPCLERCGFASLSDLQSETWTGLFLQLEAFSEKLRATENRWRISKYRWSRDPLHTCFRVWEYPYVLRHLQEFAAYGRKQVLVADLGSGATFFPLFLESRGFQVIALDSDPACAREYRGMHRRSGLGGPEFRFVLCHAERIPLRPGSLDALYCVSVLEHLADPAGALREIARVLKSDGRLILTFDVGLAPNCPLAPGLYAAVRQALNQWFDPVFPERSVHPLDLLTSDNSPYPYGKSATPMSPFAKAARAARAAARIALRRPRRRLFWTCYGGVFRPRAGQGPLAP
ncbi:MAG: class I SAM-dependent methyltransferase [Candidatus Sumerlaeota bacterium]|nr:class I SAM-dependent methyltransferase [Candidatus Sumerlaeota bacterium]